ncbi:lipid-A-disaccharide synthase [Aliikangiella sp. IMCC44632]
MTKKLFYIVSGESSGDILGAGLIAALKQRYPNAVFKGIGGPLMQAEGLIEYYPMERLAIMGIGPILKRLPELWLMRRRLARQIISEKPDCFIGIDAPVFNTQLEFLLKQADIKTVHYVSPSVWAWRENRIFKIAKSVSLMICLFPFEVEIYRQHNVKTACIGHPLADEIPLHPDQNQARKLLNIPEHEKVLALLPGSRSTEVNYLLAPFIEAAQGVADAIAGLQVIIPCANDKRRQQIEAYLQAHQTNLAIKLIDGDSRQAMLAANVVLLASGTATLEAMLLKKPMLVGYKVSAFSLWIFKKLLKINQFSLPNLIAGKPLVKELMQEDCNPENLKHELLKLFDSKASAQTVKSFYQLHENLKLGGSEKAANAICELID